MNEKEQITQLKASMFDIQQELAQVNSAFQLLVNTVTETLDIKEAETLEDLINKIKEHKVEAKAE